VWVWVGGWVGGWVGVGRGGDAEHRGRVGSAGRVGSQLAPSPSLPEGACSVQAACSLPSPGPGRAQPLAPPAIRLHRSGSWARARTPRSPPARPTIPPAHRPPRRSRAAAAALRERVAALEQAEQLRRVRQQAVGKMDAAAGGPDLGRCAGAGSAAAAMHVLDTHRQGRVQGGVGSCRPPLSSFAGAQAPPAEGAAALPMPAAGSCSRWAAPREQPQPQQAAAASSKGRQERRRPRRKVGRQRLATRRPAASACLAAAAPCGAATVVGTARLPLDLLAHHGLSERLPSHHGLSERLPVQVQAAAAAARPAGRAASSSPAPGSRAAS
jgi:hypothetical protein